MGKSIFWYDFEATGVDPRRDRPLQVAGVRTDENLQEIGEPLCIDCRLAEDILPHPMACLITGIDPDRVRRGLPEAQFMHLLHEQMARPGTCSAGYNNLRYDDEMTRFTLFRNYFDPYAREWQGGNSRWDLLDALRTAHALRPEGIHWPQQDGFASLRLELLTAANGIDHSQAHDALADVRATIAMARLLRQAQPRLYEYLYRLRDKHRVAALVDLQGVRPLVHVSGRFGRERRGLGLVMPLAWHPGNRNALIVWDLSVDPALLQDLGAEQLRQLLYTRAEELTPGQVRPGLKLVHINKCPVLADVKVLRPADIERLQLDMPLLLKRADQLAGWRVAGQEKLMAIYGEQERQAQQGGEPEAETLLYDGFTSDRDRQLLSDIRQAAASELTPARWPLEDQRLADMLKRYRARNFPESLNSTEQAEWRTYCRERLTANGRAAVTLEAFMQEIQHLQQQVSERERELLAQWQQYAMELAESFRIITA